MRKLAENKKGPSRDGPKSRGAAVESGATPYSHTCTKLPGPKDRGHGAHDGGGWRASDQGSVIQVAGQPLPGVAVRVSRKEPFTGGGACE